MKKLVLIPKKTINKKKKINKIAFNVKPWYITIPNSQQSTKPNQIFSFLIVNIILNQSLHAAVLQPKEKGLEINLKVHKYYIIFGIN